MTDFSKPFGVTDPSGRDVFSLMPKMEDIPEPFRRGKTPFNEIQRAWFSRGLTQWPLYPKPGIDHKAALAHLRAIQSSRTPHKEAAVAYLMSLWYEPPKPPQRPRPKMKRQAFVTPKLPKRTGPLKGGLDP